MRSSPRSLAVVGVALVAFVARAPELGAKSETKKITIAGDTLASPIVITDPAILGRFNVWTGPGTGGTVQGIEWKATEGFVVAGTTPVDPAPGLARYEVTFLVDRQDRDGHDMAYVIYYEYDARADRGYVYFPGRNDPQWRTNVFMIMRDIEGRWYPASRAWQDVVTPLLK
ncbi:MAG: hypothetical protein HY048_07150 [Acidobacteria bacterium]|nr:hypothetical protein [Acidobacteriota bacterium]